MYWPQREPASLGWGPKSQEVAEKGGEGGGCTKWRWACQKIKRMEVEVGEGVKCCKGGGGALTVG